MMAKSIEIYQKFTGKYPKGWAAPYWDVSSRSIQILEDFGIQYDHSLMHHDCLPYYASDVGDAVVNTDYSKDPDTWMVPMKQHKVTKIIELPANWDVDDWRKFSAFFQIFRSNRGSSTIEFVSTRCWWLFKHS